MSGKAMSWSRTIKVGSSSAKQVLRELCICQNEQTGHCTLSIKSLIEITELSETTVLKALAFLKEKGFVCVEKIKTKNGWGNSYSFPMMAAPQTIEGTPRTEDTPKFEGTLNSKGEGTPRTEDTGTPKTRDLKKEEKNTKKLVASADAPKAKVRNSFVTASKPDDVPQALWDDFITHRRAKKAPVTETVITRTRSQAQKCGMTLAEALEMTVARGWQGFEARYVKDEEKPAHNPYRVKAPVEPQEPPRRNPFLVSNTTRPAPQSKTPEQIEEERSFDLFCRVMDGKFEGGQDDPFA